MAASPPQKGSILSDEDAVFDVAQAEQTGSGGGTIVTDQRRKHKSVVGLLGDAASEWAKRTGTKIQSVGPFKKEKTVTVSAGKNRKKTIEKAATNVRRAPEDDHDAVLKRLRTLHEDAAPIQSTPFTVRKDLKREKPSWTEEKKPEQPKQEIPKKVSRRIVRKKDKHPKKEAPGKKRTSPENTEKRSWLPKIKLPSVSLPKLSRTAWMWTGIGILALLLVATGGAGILYFWDGSETQPTPVATTPETPPAFFAIGVQVPVTLEQDREALLLALRETLEAHGATLVQTYITLPNTDIYATASDFFAVLDAEVPRSFVRTLDADLMVGGVRSGSMQPFLIVAPSSYDTAFGGLLAWEETMSRDLAPLFGEAISPVIFTDQTIGGVHVRVLTDSSETEHIVYGFVRRDLILITTTTAAFERILTELE